MAIPNRNGVQDFSTEELENLIEYLAKYPDGFRVYVDYPNGERGYHTAEQAKNVVSNELNRRQQEINVEDIRSIFDDYDN